MSTATTSSSISSTSTIPQPPVTSDVIGEIDGPEIHWRVFDLELTGPVVLVDGRLLMLRGGSIADGGGTVWASDDGSDWTVFGSLMGEGQADGVFPHRVSRIGSRIGVSGDYQPPGNHVRVPAIWVSTDGGVTWNMPALPRAFAVAPTPDGFVAIGSSSASEWVTTRTSTGQVWTSVDGVDWELLFESEDPEGHGSNIGRIVWHDGWLALGSVAPHFVPDEDNPSIPDDWPHIPSAWLNGSGPTPSNRPSIWQLISTRFGVIGVAPFGMDPGTLWQSQTGVAWTQIDVREGWQVSVADYEDETLYVSAWKRSQGETPGVEDAGLWVTEDLASWWFIPVPEETSIGLDLWIEGENVVLVGLNGQGISHLAVGTLIPDDD